ncbi:iron-containing alcohol dehydrogenase [Marinibactrum halimedae]|uniref:NADH-dependent alcohol dehydrogenase n=1 Tax=Marinibactrum halimedae TaxID=1444977 RepID=A0AA37T9Q8_9GAMM|nr:iron-containing alcohol dehydrogenase [Marinibactrum halimedae]MCD9458572.1 iron-containing alcohol dehydrogenase [Marinibactrum halimedae]GLS26561.1 NADH-dependent alcohol dehydrogenase [Marinibactrum halimedae]
MLDFDYYNPTHIVFGQNRLAELDKLIPSDAKVMITFGGQSAKKFGTIDKVREGLQSRSVVEFGGIEPNPRYETLMRAVEIAQKEGVDFLLAVGGGSVMDGTKFIALAAKKDSEHHNLLFHGFTPVPEKEALPLGCVATLPATGSEMNMAGVITYNEQKYPFMSPLVYPTFSFLDPDFTFTLPKEQIANGVADAFVHVIEQYLTVPVNAKIQDRFAEGVLKTLIEDGPVTYRDNDNIEARKNFIWSATSALNGVIGVGVPQDWSTHMIGHEMTAMYGIAHGRTLAIILPHLLRERKAKKYEKLVQFAERVWAITDGTDDEKINMAIDKTEAFFNSLDIVTNITHYGIDDNGIETIVNNMEKMGLTALSESGDLTLDIVKKILIAAK